MTEPLPGRTAETVVWLREKIEEGRANGTTAPEFCDTILRMLDLYGAAAAQARRDDSFLQAWALNFDLQGFTLPNESGARTLLPGLTATIHHLALAFSDDEIPRVLFSVPTRDD